MKKKDTDYIYATTRVRALERNMLNSERIERMLDAKDAEDAIKILDEIGYSDISEPTLSQIEVTLSENRAKTIKMMRDITDNQELINVFCLKYDYHNIKTLLKANALGQDARRILIDTSCVPVSVLETAIHKMDYSGLSPIMCAGIEEARETLSKTFDPQLSDFILDRACFTQMKIAAENAESTFLTGYVRLLTDVLNLRVLVRVGRQQRSMEFLKTALIDGGSVNSDRLISARGSASAIKELFFKTPLESAAVAGRRALSGESGLLKFERLCDDALIEYSKSAKYTAFGDAPLVAYLIAKEAETTAIRIIMTGKLENLPADEIRSRLRLSYV